MGIVGDDFGGSVPGVGSGGGLGLTAMDFYPSWGPSRREALFLGLEAALYFTPLTALAFSNKVRLGIKLFLMEKKADKTIDAYRIGTATREYLLARKYRTAFLVATSAPGAFVTASGLVVFPLMAGDFREIAIAYYMDREGNIRVILPNLAHKTYESRGDQGTVLPAARRSRSFFDEDGIAKLAATDLSRTSPSQWHIATTGTNRNFRGNPLAEGPVTRARSAPTRSGKKKISPWCRIHKRRHWCSLTRAMF